MKPAKPVLRGDVYHLKRRVPRRYAAVAESPWVRISLATDSLQIARRKAEVVWSEHIEAWEALLTGNSKDAEACLARARDIAQRRGYRWLHVEDVARLPMPELLDRIEQIRDVPTKADRPMIEAMLGTPPKSGIKVSEAVEEFYKIADDRLIGKNEDQLRRHKNPRKKATANFIKAVGDKPLSEVTTEDMFALRAWWMPRVKSGEVRPASANKDFNNLLPMWRQIARAKGFELGINAAGLPIQDVMGAEVTRPPFTEGWIRAKLLDPGALGGLNPDARLILIGMINTGYRPSEGAGLLPDEICIEANVPHIVIQPNRNRTLKNKQSRRAIPLVGVSLEAFREARSGFPRYAANSATLSATVNKFLAENGLLETPAHSLYSLRHGLEDRMLKAGIDERIRMDVLGHQIKRERYGDAGGLTFMQEQLLKIAI